MKNYSILILLALCASCTSTKDLHKVSEKKDSISKEVSLGFQLEKVDSIANVSYQETNVITDKGNTKTKDQEHYTETTKTEYQKVHTDTPAADYFPKGVIKLNDSTLLVPVTTKTKSSTKTKSKEKQDDKKDSTNNKSSDNTDLKKFDSSLVSNKKDIAIHLVTQTKDLHKTTSYWSWWYLLALILVVIFRYRKKIAVSLGLPAYF